MSEAAEPSVSEAVEPELCVGDGAAGGEPEPCKGDGAVKGEQTCEPLAKATCEPLAEATCEP